MSAVASRSRTTALTGSLGPVAGFGAAVSFPELGALVPATGVPALTSARTSSANRSAVGKTSGPSKR